MDTEYEATFLEVDKNEIRERLEKAGAKLIKPEFLQKRTVFHPPQKSNFSWLRVRDEGDKITMSFKLIRGNNIKDQKEICLEVDDFKKAENFLLAIGCAKKAYQESKRELWMLGGTEIMIDTWPFLETFVEIEGKSEKEVKKTAEKLGFDYNEAFFCAADAIYKMKYGVSLDKIDNRTKKIVFNMKNPFKR